MTMNKKIIFWLDSNLTYFCLAHFLQKELDADFYAIIDAPYHSKQFYEQQKLVKFKKTWYLHDFVKKKKNPMLTMKKIYLKLVTPYKLKSQNLIQKINDLKY